MKLSPKTLSLLKHFAGINVAILVRPGNLISTITKARNMYAKAVVPETFEREFAIYDLAKFLSIVSMFDDPDLEFSDKYVTIQSGKRKVRYVYAERVTIDCPPDKVPDTGDVYGKFTMSTAAMQNVIRAAGVLGLPDVRIKADGKTVEIQALNTTEPTQNVFTETIEADTSGNVFSVEVKTDCLKMMPSDYEVTVTERALLLKGADVEYLMALNV